MRVLITGGAGFIGSHLAEALLARGDEVAIIDDLSTGRFENIQPLVGKPGFHFAIDTITHALVLDRLASECDVIVHLAAAVGVELIIHDPVRTIETNVLGTHAVLQAAARYRKKVLLASTSEVYGKSNAIPFREDADRVLGTTTKSRWSYSDSKAIDEFLGLAYHKKHGLPVIICRFFNTVGPRQTGQYGMVIPRFVQQALRGDPITVYGDGSQSRCFCNVRDTVRAVISLVECPEAVGEVFNVGSTEEVAILELARQVLHLVTGERQPQATERLVFVPYAQAYEPGFEDMQRRVPDVGKLQHFTGWESRVPLRETLQQVIEYYQLKRMSK
ncbi:MAG: nucleoside-diphosphate sugar epimerase [Chloroflexi bacterium]|nr:MAG: nucleoside-diphosphate sugar epimerase [Chloroflexota bacterium]